MATVKEVGLETKVNARSQGLSGGQKRKLSVGIALIGGSKVRFFWMLQNDVYRKNIQNFSLQQKCNNCKFLILEKENKVLKVLIILYLTDEN